MAAALWGTASAGGAEPLSWRASLEGSGRYNSNLTLLSADAPVDIKSAWLTELNGRLSASRVLGSWRVEGQLSGLSNLHTDHTEENWHFTRGRVGLRRQVGKGTAELSSETR
jgi:hypothetical protein